MTTDAETSKIRADPKIRKHIRPSERKNSVRIDVSRWKGLNGEKRLRGVTDVNLCLKLICAADVSGLIYF